MGGDSRAVEASRDSSGVRFSCTRGSNLKVYPSPDQDGTALGRLVGGVRISKHAGDIPPTGHGAEEGQRQELPPSGSGLSPTRLMKNPPLHRNWLV